MLELVLQSFCLVRGSWYIYYKLFSCCSEDSRVQLFFLTVHWVGLWFVTVAFPKVYNH